MYFGHFPIWCPITSNHAKPYKYQYGTFGLFHIHLSHKETLQHSLLPKKSNMASATISLGFFLALSLLLHGALGEIICENLPNELCAFSIASSGKRCLLENYSQKNGETEYQCKTSEVVVDKMADYIESDDCVKACGIDRSSVGISSDSLLEPQATAKICAQACYQNCPNVVDLYFNLAAGEGVFLPDLCEAQHTNPRRAMIELLSSGVAAGPASSELIADGPVGSSFFTGAPLGSPKLYANAPAPAPTTM